MLRSVRWLKAIWRTEFRNIVLNPSRHVLVCLLIAIPIAALVAGANFLFVTDPTNAERATSEMGRADLRVDVGGLLTATELRRQLPAGSQVEIVSRNIDEVRVPGRSMDIQSWRMDVDSLAKGMLDVVRGDAPQNDAEVAVSDSLLKSLDVEVGDFLTVRDEESKIVGVVENPEALDAPVLLRAALNAGFVQTALIALPEDADPAVQIDSVRITSRDDVALDFTDVDGFMLVAIFGFAEAALVIAAAFVVGLRRRQREIGLLASCGGSPVQVLASVVASAFLISLVAAVVGTAVGVLIVRASYPWFDELKGRRCGDFDICWGRHVFAMTLGVLTGVISATLPAIAAARLPIRTALSGRRPAPRGSGRFMLIGFLLVAAGVALVWYAPSLVDRDAGGAGDNSAIQTILAGSILGVIGFGLWSPWLLGRFATLASWLPLSARLAVREVGRFRTRNGPIVTAILAGMSLSVMMATFYQGVQGIQARYGRQMREDQVVVRGPGAADVATQIINTVGGTSRSEARIAAAGNQPLLVQLDSSRQVRVAIGGEQLLRTLGVSDSDLADAISELQAGKLLCLGEVDTKEPIPITTSNAFRDTPPIAELTAFNLKTSAPVTLEIGFVVGQATADELGWTTSMERTEFLRPGDWIVRFPEVVMQEQFEQARQLAAAVPLTSIDAQFNHELDTTYYWGILCIALMIGLIIVAVATMLASSEAKADQRILSVVGASPIVYRNQAAARSAFLTLLGCCLAIPAGLLPATGLVSILPVMELDIPWMQLFLGAIILPTTAAALTWISCRGLSLKPATIGS